MRLGAMIFCSVLSTAISLTTITTAAATTTTTTTIKASHQNLKVKSAQVKKATKKQKVSQSSKQKKDVARRSTSRKFVAGNNKNRYVVRRVRGPSYAQLHGLRGSNDPLGLATTAVLAYDLNTNEVLYEKNADQPLPIASITKLMTAVVIVESKVNLNEKFVLTREDFVESSARSKLRAGMTLSRKQALHLALMSSDNRAAHFLARTYPGGTATFIRDMNTKAALLGMSDTVFYDSIGLDNGNRSSAIDLSHLIASASEYEIIRELSTTPEASFSLGKRYLISANTNALVRDDSWDVELQKTGLTTAAGYCMVMQTNISGKSVAMILLDSPNKAARNHDARKLRQFLEEPGLLTTAMAH